MCTICVEVIKDMGCDLSANSNVYRYIFICIYVNMFMYVYNMCRSDYRHGL
jgi:hypothetical protein